MDEQDSIDKFGQFITEKLRDNSIDFAQNVMNGHYKSDRLKELQNQLSFLDGSHKKLAMDFVKTVIDTGIHDFLFALQERSCNEGDIVVLVDGEDVVEESDGIHGEAYTEDGWYAMYSKYGAVN